MLTRHSLLLLLVLCSQLLSSYCRLVSTDEECSPHRPTLQPGLPVSRVAAVGSDVEFECKVIRGRPAHIQWLKHMKIDGSRVSPNGLPYIRVLKTAGLNSTVEEMEVLQLRNVSLDDAGEYTCLAGNSMGYTHRSAWLTISEVSVTSSEDDAGSEEEKLLGIEKEMHKPPQWVQPQRMAKGLLTVPSAKTVKFRCQARGIPTPTLKWYKNREEFKKDHRIGGFKVRDHVGTIIMESVVPSDKGNYTCVVENQYGSINHTYQLDVVERSPHKPILLDGLPANRTAVVGSDVEFECKVYSDLKPHIQWLKNIEINGSRTAPDGIPYIRVLKSVSVDTLDKQVLQLRNVSFEDAGLYTCLVGNSAGYSFRSAWLTIFEETRNGRC